MTQKSSKRIPRESEPQTTTMVCPQFEAMANLFIDSREDCLKFDTRDRGWSPAGGRLRKTLLAVARQCATLRKTITTIKNAEK